MPSSEGLILDATALIDFCWLDEWKWLQQQYNPLFIAQEVLDSDRLEDATSAAATRYLEPLALDTEEMFLSFMESSQNWHFWQHSLLPWWEYFLGVVVLANPDF